MLFKMFGIHLLLAALLTNACQGKTLKMVHLMYRHGARSPIAFYPADPHQEKDWRDGAGRLTQIGMNMEYELGKFLRERYMVQNMFLNQTYLHRQVYIRSSNVDRCLQSAESQVAGLYPPKGYQVWNPRIQWQPIPVHTLPKEEDVIVRPYDVYCPRLKQIFKERKEKPDYKQKLLDNKALMLKLSVLSGMEIATADDLYKIADPTLAEMAEGLKIPKGIKELWNETAHLASWFILSKFVGDDELGRLLGGSFVAMMNDNMKKASTHAPASSRLYKMNIFSAHDTSVLALFAALDVESDMVFPDFSACVMIEMYESEKGYFVEMVYRHDISNKVKKLKLRKCDYSCPLDEFIKLTRPRTTHDRSKICGVKGSFFSFVNLEIIAVILTCFSLLLLIMLLYFFVRHSSSYAQKYKKVLVKKVLI